MMKRSIIFVTLAICAPMTSAPAQELVAARVPEPISDEATADAVRADLLSVLRPVSQIRAQSSNRRLGVVFETRPHAAGYVGLCRKDSMWLDYVPQAKAAPGKEVPDVPHGITVSSSFRALGGLQALTGIVQAVVAGDDPCVDPPRGKEGRWIRAPDVESVIATVHLLASLQARVRAGTLTPTCADPGDEPLRCREEILSISSTEDPDSVDACDAKAGQRCLSLGYYGHTSVSVSFVPTGDRALPGAIEAVEVSQDITIVG